MSKHSVPLHANFCFLRNSAIGWKSGKLTPHYYDGDEDDDGDDDDYIIIIIIF